MKTKEHSNPQQTINSSLLLKGLGLALGKGWGRLLLLLAIHLFTLSPLHAQISEQFTTEHPLVYEDAWDLWPYTYLNDNGDPEGYNIDLLKLLCKEMNIPYIIKLKSTAEALQDLKDGKSDLMMGMAADFHDEYGQYSMTVIQLFTHSVVYPKSKPLKVKKMSDLASHRVIVHAGAFSHHLMEDKGWGANAVPFDDMKEAIIVAAEKQDMPIVWNTLSLKWLMHRFNIENMDIAPIDIPHGEYRFMSNNGELLAAIDEAYVKLQANDKLREIQNRWFYPEREETGVPSWIWNMAVILALIALASLVYYLILHYREKKMTELIAKENKRLSLILQTGNMRVWTYDIATQKFTWLKQANTEEKVYEKAEFGKRYSPEDFEHLCKALDEIAAGKTEKASFEHKIYKVDDQASNEYHDCQTNLSVLRRNRSGNPTVIIGTGADFTKIRTRQKNVHDLMQRYQSIYETAMVDMAYYDKEGIIADMNQKCSETFNATLQELRAKKTPVQKIVGEEDLASVGTSSFHATLKLPKDGGGNRTDDSHGDFMFYELQLVPASQTEEQTTDYYSAGRDVTEVAYAYHTQRQNIKRLEEATGKIKTYIDNINYALRVGGVRMVNYSPTNHQLTIFSETDKVMFALTQARSIHLCSDKSKYTIGRLLESMDNRTDKPIKAEVMTTIKDKKRRQLYLQFHFLPTYDKNGQVENYFGICRDISDIKQTALQLEAETLKAQDVETVKNSFLHNMSYEIRTPLNTVVGFAELFHEPHTAEDETIFVDEIKCNSRKLLNLVNNILFLSRMDAHMIELYKQPTDFATTFETHCNFGWNDYQNPGVTYTAESNYSRFVADIDDQNIGIIIANITANAAQYTDKGSVHANFSYTGDHLVITVDDTGYGIEEKDLVHIFERFATGAKEGSGLGLSICHELVSLMGGTINIKSKVGKGTTVWVSIPCQVSEFERK